ncbi:MAG: hypothetical protein ACM3US_07355 [Sphingomonadaceae bacterium]
MSTSDARLLVALWRSGAALWVENGVLRVAAPAGAVDQATRDDLAIRKWEIRQLLQAQEEVLATYAEIMATWERRAMAELAGDAAAVASADGGLDRLQGRYAEQMERWWELAGEAWEELAEALPLRPSPPARQMALMGAGA